VRRLEGELPRWRDGEGQAVVPHGFRSTFRDWAGETRNDGHDVVEAALAHTIKNKSEAAYARSDLVEKRRVLMDAWATHCSPPAGGVVVLAERWAQLDNYSKPQVA
jgi:integrase